MTDRRNRSKGGVVTDGRVRMIVLSKVKGGMYDVSDKYDVIIS